MFKIGFIILISVSLILAEGEKTKKVTLLSLSKCPVKVGKEILDTISLNTIEEEQSMSMTVNIEEPLGEEEMVAVEGSILYDGDYKHFFAAKDINVCQMLEYIKPVWDDFKAKLNPPLQGDGCHIEPGRYNMENYPLPSKIPADNMPTGQVKTKIVFYHGKNEDVACVEYEVLLE